MFTNKKNNHRAFTLVELLVVIAIIGILTSVVYYSFADSRAQSRDRVRMTNLKELQLAVESYKAQNGRYPAGCNTGWSGETTNSSYKCTDGTNSYIKGLTPDFIGSLPTETKNTGGASSGYLYRTNSTGSTYKIMAYGTVEAIKITAFSENFARCPKAGGSSCATIGNIEKTYAVYGGDPTSKDW